MNAIAAIEGSGDHRVLVLHGWALDSSVWLTARARTDQSRFTYAYLDFPGYGVNRPEAPADGIDGMAAVASTPPISSDGRPFPFSDIRWGGTTALRVATLAPERVTSVVALTPVSPGRYPSRRSDLRFLRRGPGQTRVQPSVAHWHHTSTRQI